MVEQTRQTVSKMNFIIISNFKPTGHSAQDKISDLLRREAQKKSENALDKASSARYNEMANAV